MDDFRFNSVEELYNKLLPALNTKVNDLKRNKIDYITPKDVWNYLRYNYWLKKSKLTLGEMVNDILSTPNFELEEYMHKNKKEENNLL
jgi:aspartate carbamoyltransferase regulatory subunit